MQKTKRGEENEIKKRRTQLPIFLLIFLCFFWTGSAYITWLYRLTELFGSTSADWISEVAGYLLQAMGILFFSLLFKYRPRYAKSAHCLTVAVLADGAAMTGALLAGTGSVVLIFGLLMNLLHGAIAGVYLTKLALYVPQQKKDTVFGLAYGLGGVGSWLLSLPLGHSFLHTGTSLIAYLVLMGLILLLNYTSKPESLSDEVDNSSGFRRPAFALIFSVVILLSVVKGIGFYFPMSQPAGGTVNLEFSRAFYAVGLVVAGLIGDKNRKYGAICCLAALVFPFISLALDGVPDAAAAIWILGYVFFGFFAVYRVVLFCDIAAKKKELMWTAGFGLLFGRVGDAAGSACGILMQWHDVLLITVSAVLFVVTVLLFFALYHKLYVPVLTQEQNKEKLLSEFESRFGLSARECEVFWLILKGRSNAEIAGDLYISESTVKFHVKNVLKKTACGNRTELSVKFKQA